MSERSKGDVSSSSSLSASSSRVNNNRVVKNPLLSASVTGLSFDDFPNKPLLLPAAPPVVHAPPPQPTTALIAGILNRGKCVRDGAEGGGNSRSCLVNCHLLLPLPLLQLVLLLLLHLKRLQCKQFSGTLFGAKLYVFCSRLPPSSLSSSLPLCATPCCAWSASDRWAAPVIPCVACNTRLCTTPAAQ